MWYSISAISSQFMLIHVISNQNIIELQHFEASRFHHLIWFFQDRGCSRAFGLRFFGGSPGVLEIVKICSPWPTRNQTSQTIDVSYFFLIRYCYFRAFRAFETTSVFFCVCWCASIAQKRRKNTSSCRCHPLPHIYSIEQPTSSPSRSNWRNVDHMFSGQFLTTSADLTPNSGLSKGILPRVIQIQNSEMILETNYE